MNELGLSYEALQDLRTSRKSNVDYSKALLDRGVKSKPLREKLSSIIKPAKS